MSTQRVSDAESVAADRLMSLAVLFEQQKSEPATKEAPPSSQEASSPKEAPEGSAVAKPAEHPPTTGNSPSSPSTRTVTDTPTIDITNIAAETKKLSGDEIGKEREHGTADKVAVEAPTSSTEDTNETANTSQGSRNPSWIHTAMHNYRQVVTDANSHEDRTGEKSGDISSTLTTTNRSDSVGRPDILQSGGKADVQRTSSDTKAPYPDGRPTSSMQEPVAPPSSCTSSQMSDRMTPEAKNIETHSDDRAGNLEKGKLSPTTVGSPGSNHSKLDETSGKEERRPSLPRTYFVTHDYVDHSNVRCDDMKDFEASIPKRSNRGGVKSLFPEKLHQLLSMGEEHVDPSIISWAPHGRCFSVHNVREFTRELMPRYFNHTAITSFQRQLNLYGFKRITKTGSKDQGAYYHELFLRGRPMLCRRMRRQKIKGTGYKPLPDPDNEPDFYSMDACYEDDLKDQKTSGDEEALALGQAGKSAPKYEISNMGSNSPTAGSTRKAPEQDDPTKKHHEEPPSKMARTTAAVSSELSNYLPHGRDIITSPRQNDASQVLRQAASGNTPRSSQEGLIVGAVRQGAVGMVPNSPTSLRNSSLQNVQQHRLQQQLGVPNSSEMVLQQLLSRAYGEGNGSGVVRGDRTAIQEEIEMLEATRRNVMLQQQRLDLLIGGGSSSGRQQQQHSYHLGQLTAAYDNASPTQSSTGTAASVLPNAAAAAANQAVVGRSLAGLDRGALAGVAASAANGTPAGGTNALYSALEDLAASGRISNEQLDGIEAILASGRAQSSLQQQSVSGISRFARNGWI